jgi:hypothetical protein
VELRVKEDPIRTLRRYVERLTSPVDGDDYDELLSIARNGSVRALASLEQVQQAIEDLKALAEYPWNSVGHAQRFARVALRPFGTTDSQETA